MIGGAAAPNVTVLYVFRLIQGFGLGALLVVLFAAFTEYVPGKNRGVWSSRNSFIGNFAHPICNGIALVIVSTGVSMNMNWRISTSSLLYYLSLQVSLFTTNTQNLHVG